MKLTDPVQLGKYAPLWRKILDVEEVTALDVLFNVPRQAISRVTTAVRDLNYALAKTDVTVEITVTGHQSGNSAKAPAKVKTKEGVEVVLFNTAVAQAKRRFPLGARLIVGGKLGFYGPTPQIANPDYTATLPQHAANQGASATYALVDGLSNRMVHHATLRFLRQFTAFMRALPEWQVNPAVSFFEAIWRLHNPSAPADIALDAPPRLRLAFDELLAIQLGLKLRRRQRLRARLGMMPNGNLALAILVAFGHRLTDDQKAAWEDIKRDLASCHLMDRLVLGDTGSGKSIVALLSAAGVIETGAQAMLCAPTEILARQHYDVMAPLCAAAGIKIGILTGREKGKAREQILEDWRSGGTQLLIGTQALAEPDVIGHDVRLVIMDEEQRVGAEFKQALRKGEVDYLALSATPIPRSLRLAWLGHTEVSELREKPKGRLEVLTYVVPLSQLSEVVKTVKNFLAAGEQCIWVCSLIEENELVVAKSLEERLEYLKEFIPEEVIGVVHGKLKIKNEVMKNFAEGKFKLLLSTTVAEIGIDIGGLTILVAESSERYGLSSCHQMRGRLARRGQQGHAIFVYDEELISETAMARLNVLRSTSDGFRLAEEDLHARNFGDLLGVRQSGMPDYKIAEMPAHEGLIEKAAKEADEILEDDPHLHSPRGEALKVLMDIFKQE
jgi:ATP-dependent DNA helicase RecG